MDKTARLKYAFGLTDSDISADDAPMMAIVVGVMHAVKSELEMHPDSQPEDTHLAGLLAKLPQPNPDLSPEQVLQIQLSALKLNDIPTPDHGIFVAHSFCTPESRDYLGCPQQLGVLFRDPMYAPLLKFSTVQFQPISIKADRASQRFSVTTADGVEAQYVAHLLLQKSGEQANCWLTDAIFRVAGQ